MEGEKKKKKFLLGPKTTKAPSESSKEAPKSKSSPNSQGSSASSLASLHIVGKKKNLIEKLSPEHDGVPGDDISVHNLSRKELIDKLLKSQGVSRPIVVNPFPPFEPPQRENEERKWTWDRLERGKQNKIEVKSFPNAPPLDPPPNVLDYSNSFHFPVKLGETTLSKEMQEKWDAINGLPDKRLLRKENRENEEEEEEEKKELDSMDLEDQNNKKKRIIVLKRKQQYEGQTEPNKKQKTDTLDISISYQKTAETSVQQQDEAPISTKEDQLVQKNQQKLQNVQQQPQQPQYQMQHVQFEQQQPLKQPYRKQQENPSLQKNQQGLKQPQQVHNQRQQENQQLQHNLSLPQPLPPQQQQQPQNQQPKPRLPPHLHLPMPVQPSTAQNGGQQNHKPDGPKLKQQRMVQFMTKTTGNNNVAKAAIQQNSGPQNPYNSANNPVPNVLKSGQSVLQNQFGRTQKPVTSTPKITAPPVQQQKQNQGAASTPISTCPMCNERFYPLTLEKHLENCLANLIEF